MATKEGYIRMTDTGDACVFIPGKGKFNVSVERSRMIVRLETFGRVSIHPIVSNAVEISAEDFS